MIAQESKQGQNNTQVLIQDQNYSHEIFFSVLSALESLVLSLEQKHKSGFGSKVFKGYDRTDFSQKSFSQLKSQLQIQVLLFKNSRKCFQMEHTKVQWRLPHNFNEAHAESFTTQVIYKFKQAGETDCERMACDVLNILEGKSKDTYAEQPRLTPSCSNEEKEISRQNLVRDGMLSQEEMESRAREAQGLTSPDQLQAKINNGTKRAPHQQNKEEKGKGQPMEVENHTYSQKPTKDKQAEEEKPHSHTSPARRSSNR